MSSNEKMASNYFKNNPIDLPSIFFNILHLAIEHNAMDVLRICLKYGLDPNKPGTVSNTVNHSLKNENNQANKKAVRYFIDCNYCLKKKSKNNSLCNNLTVHNNPAFLFFLSTSKQVTDTLKTSESVQTSPVVKQQTETTTCSQQVNYSSYSYLVQYPPLFLSISKCNHAATDLLLTYGVCTNIQDDLGMKKIYLFNEASMNNIFFFFSKVIHLYI